MFRVKSPFVPVTFTSFLPEGACPPPSPHPPKKPRVKQMQIFICDHFSPPLLSPTYGFFSDFCFYTIGVALTDKMLDGWLSHLKQAGAGHCTLKGRMMACKWQNCFSVQECDQDRMPLNRENVILRFQLRRNVETYCQGGFSHVWKDFNTHT